MKALEQLNDYLLFKRVTLSVRGLLILLYIHREKIIQRADLIKRMNVTRTVVDGEVKELVDSGLLFRKHGTFKVPNDIAAYLDLLTD